MKTGLLILLVACQGVVALAQDNKAPYETKSLASAAIKEVYVNTSGGSISVSGASGEEARIEMYVRGNNNADLSKEEIKKRLDDDYIVEVSVANHELHASAKRK